MALLHSPTISISCSFLIPRVPTAPGRTYQDFLRQSTLDSILLVASFDMLLLPLAQVLVVLVLVFHSHLLSFRVVLSWYQEIEMRVNQEIEWSTIQDVVLELNVRSPVAWIAQNQSWR